MLFNFDAPPSEKTDRLHVRVITNELLYEISIFERAFSLVKVYR